MIFLSEAIYKLTGKTEVVLFYEWMNMILLKGHSRTV